MKLNMLWQANNSLAESPIWDATQQILYWIDIENTIIHSLNPLSKQHRSWDLPSKPGCIALHADGGLLVALYRSIVHLNLENNAITTLLEPFEKNQELRFNDGCCDANGRFWIGTGDIKGCRPIGDLRCFGFDNTLMLKDQGFFMSNGIAWSPDQRYMYFSDSIGHTIYRYDYERTTGAINNRKIFATTHDDASEPDGLIVDSQGFIWSAHWDGWRITRYAPDGHIDCVIPVPAQRVTSCCFGGPHLDQLFITTARYGLTAAELAKGPLAGSVFAVETGIKGQLENIFKG